MDMTSAGAHPLLGVMVQHQVPVAYVSGLVMRRAADLYAGAAKTDPRDAWVLADYARRNPDRLQWVEINDELLVRLRVPNGHDTDLAVDAKPDHQPLPRRPNGSLTCTGTCPGTTPHPTTEQAKTTSIMSCPLADIRSV